MKIKMLTTSAGPDPQFNFTEGDERNVTVEEARYWDKAGVCTLLEPYPSDAEKAIVVPAQKAVVTPPETATVQKPAKQASAPAADWGKK